MLLFQWTRLLPAIQCISFISAVPTSVPSAASFYVRNLPDLHQDKSHPLHIYAGHIESDPNGSSLPTDVSAHLFFVLVKARRTADKERIMFWFNGGPGCSSFDGLMMEIGPWRVDGKGGLKAVEGGWEEYTHMVYVDQPAGTGFSYTSTNHYVHSLPQASEQIVHFLRTWYQVFPEYLSMDAYLGGESFAGQYIPYFANAILSSNLNIPLRGLAIGNGWMDARRQYPAYLDYAVKHGIIEQGSDAYKESKKNTDACVDQLRHITGPEPIAIAGCEDLVRSILAGKDATSPNGTSTCVNIYDVRLKDTQPACGMNWPPDVADIATYLDRRDVISALHATAKSESWTECRGRIRQEFNDQNSPSSIELIPKVLQQMPILFFAGDQDFICNYMGIENMIKAMTWNGATGLGTVKTQVYSVKGSPAGTWVSSRNLTYVKLFNASHMAPYDIPTVAHDMILRFMGMNFSAIMGGSAAIPSSIGDTDTKPIFQGGTEHSGGNLPTGKTPEQNKAKWEAYYNAGSAALVLILISLAIAAFLWFRIRRNRLQLPDERRAEEEIPLRSAMGTHDESRDDEELFRKRKGKERALDEPESHAVFDVGDSDDEDGYKSPDPRSRG